MRHVINTFTLRHFTVATAAGLLGYFANGHGIRVWNGVEILPGSVLSYGVVALFGVRWGGFTALLAGARTLVEWGHPFAWILHVLEIIIVGRLLRVGLPLAAGSAVFWMGLGLPLVMAIYRGYLHLSWQFVWMLALADFLPGLISALVAHLFVSSHRLRSLWRRMSAECLPPPSLRSDIFAGTLLVGTIPLFSGMLVNGTVIRHRGEEAAKARLANHAAIVAACLDRAGQAARREMTGRDALARVAAERDRQWNVVDVGPGIRVLLAPSSGGDSAPLPPRDQEDFDLPFERVAASQPPFGSNPLKAAILRINPASACRLHATNLDSVRVAIVDRNSETEFLSYVPASGNAPASGFVEARTLVAAMGTAISGPFEFRRVTQGANSFQKPAYLGGHALSQFGFRVVFYQPAARALGPASNLQMWAIFLVFVAVFGSAAFAFWFDRRITAPVTHLRRYLEGIQTSPAIPGVGPSDNMDIEVEMRPVWTGIVDLERRTAAALAKSEEAANAALAATRQKSDFLATVSHEVRTPLNCVLGMLPRVRAEQLSNGQREAVELIERSGEHLLSILNDVLDFSRIEQGRVRLHSEQVETIFLLEEAFEMMAPVAVAKGLEFSWVCSPSIPAFCQVDSLRTKQILLNVVTNAVKFTDSGSVEIDTAWSPGADPDGAGRLICKVRDTGPGIAPDHLAKLFQPFWQLNHPVGTPQNVGAGLGLSIAKRILDVMGGDIKLESILGEGTTVTVSIPVLVTEHRPRTSGMSALIVGPSSRYRDSVASLLYFFGCTVQVQTDIPSGPGAGRGLLVEDTMAANLHTDSAGPLQSLIDAGWKVVIYQTFPCRLTGEDFKHTTAIEFLSTPASLRKLREACGRLNASGEDTAPESASCVAALRPLDILVAEDNAENRLVINLLLNGLGYTPHIVNNGTAAWAALQSTPYDVAILDLRMPGIDGLALARRIRDELPAKPKLIALTASAFESDRQLCEKAGFDAFLTKPLREADLRQVLIAGQSDTISPREADDVWSVRNLSSLISLCGDKANPMIQTVMDDIGAWLDTPILETPAEPLADRTHKLAGAAMLIGATSLAGALKDVERTVLDRSAPLDDAIEKVRREWERARQQLPRVLGTVMPPRETHPCDAR